MNGHDISSRYHLLYLAIIFALIVKYFFVRELTAMNPGKSLLADVAMNFVSTLFGVVLIPGALFLWLIFIGNLLENYLHLGTFDLGRFIAPYITVAAIFLIAVFVFAWLETLTLRFVFDQGSFGSESHWKFFWSLCIPNVFVVSLAFVILFVHFTWTWHKIL